MADEPQTTWLSSHVTPLVGRIGLDAVFTVIVVTGRLLLEGGGFLLMEDGSHFLL